MSEEEKKDEESSSASGEGDHHTSTTEKPEGRKKNRKSSSKPLEKKEFEKAAPERKAAQKSIECDEEVATVLAADGICTPQMCEPLFEGCGKQTGHYYGDYLCAVLDEGNGHISAEQYLMLEMLRSKHGVTNGDHVQLLKNHGWSLERFEAARNKLPVEYVSYLRIVLVDDKVDPEEMTALEDLRKKYSLSEDAHLRALNLVGYTEKDFLLACAKGSQTRTMVRFGQMSSKIVTGEVDRNEYCRGLCIAPHIRQWWSRDEKSGKRILVREPGADMRTATSQELFYDLVFVAVIAKLVHLFAANNPRWFEFFVMFGSVWRVWYTALFYNSKWDARDLSTRIAMYVQMFGLVCMGLSIDDSFELDGTRTFAVGQVVAMSPLVFLYSWAVSTRKRGWEDAIFQLVAIVSCPILVICSIIHGEGFLFWWLAANLLPDILTITFLFIGRFRRFRQPVNVEHMTERFGLFIIIVLGESITSLLTDLPWRGELLNWEVYVGAAAGLVIAFSLKWIYFDVDEEKAKHPFRRGPYQALPWSFAHAPLAIAIAIAAAGMYGLQHSVVYYVETEIFLHNTTDLEGGKVHKRFAAEVQEIFARSSLSELANSTNGTHADTLLPEEKNHEILFSFGVASALLILLLQAAVSKYHTHHLVPAKIRLAVRGIVALVIGLLPLGTFGIGGLVLLVVVAALVLLLALFEIVSILPGHHEEEDHIENLKQKPIEEVRSFVQRAYSSRLLMVQKPENEAADEAGVYEETDDETNATSELLLTASTDLS